MIDPCAKLDEVPGDGLEEHVANCPTCAAVNVLSVVRRLARAAAERGAAPSAGLGCARAELLAAGAFAGTTTTAERNELEAHAASCDRCRQAFALAAVLSSDDGVPALADGSDEPRGGKRIGGAMDTVFNVLVIKNRPWLGVAVAMLASAAATFALTRSTSAPEARDASVSAAPASTAVDELRAKLVDAEHRASSAEAHVSALEERLSESAGSATASTSMTAEPPAPNCACAAGDPLCACLPERPVTAGRLPPEIITRTLRANTPSEQSCYRAVLNRHPTLRGRIRVSLTISADGKTTDVTLRPDASADDPALRACLSLSISKLRFPHPDGGVVHVAYSVRLQPPGE